MLFIIIIIIDTSPFQYLCSLYLQLNEQFPKHFDIMIYYFIISYNIPNRSPPTLNIIKTGF